MPGLALAEETAAPASRLGGAQPCNYSVVTSVVHPITVMWRRQTSSLGLCTQAQHVNANPTQASHHVSMQLLHPATACHRATHTPSGAVQHGTTATTAAVPAPGCSGRGAEACTRSHGRCGRDVVSVMHARGGANLPGFACRHVECCAPAVRGARRNTLPGATPSVATTKASDIPPADHRGRRECRRPCCSLQGRSGAGNAVVTSASPA